MNVVNAFLVVAIAGPLLGIAIGYWLHHMLWRRERSRMRGDWLDIAHQHQRHAERLATEDVRLGINSGIQFAMSKMHNTLDELNEHIEEHQPKEQPK